MSMGKPTKIYAKDNPEVALKVTKGHFSSDRFHINYYIDMTSLKMRRKDAQEVAKAMVSRYVNRVKLEGNFSLSGSQMQEAMASLASKTPIDTIICMDGCEVIGAYVASELSSIGVTTLNSHHTSYIITPEFDSTGQMVVRDNIRPMLKDKHVLVVLATAMSGRTIAKSIRCINSYGGIIEGISVIFSAVDEIDGYPVNSVFGVSDLPDFRLADPNNCPDCQSGVKLDAIVNSYGYSVLD
jgi:hypothetical protein